MAYEKRLADGTIIQAPAFTHRVLGSVPVVFQLAEWVLVIAAFQFADVRFGFVAAKIVWIALAFGLAVYVGVLSSNLLWRSVEDPFSHRVWNVLVRYVAPMITGLLMLGVHHLIQNMISAEQV